MAGRGPAAARRSAAVSKRTDHDLLRRATVMNAVDPLAGKITKRGEVFLADAT